MTTAHWILTPRTGKIPRNQPHRLVYGGMGGFADRGHSSREKLSGEGNHYGKQHAISVTHRPAYGNSKFRHHHGTLDGLTPPFTPNSCTTYVPTEQPSNLPGNHPGTSVRWKSIEKKLTEMRGITIDENTACMPPSMMTDGCLWKR